ncbi:MAG: ATP-binding cassette domain-containing protein, partial [Bacteroidota bacterium]
VRQFFEPIRNLSDQYNMLQSAMAASERVFDLLDTDTAIREPEEPAMLGEGVGRIEFRGVWFAYTNLPDSDEPNWVLRDVSFTAEPGEVVALVGATGSGKSTIINLLLRFYEPQRGDILVDGIPIQTLRLADLRHRIGLVLQDVFLFSGSIEENITLGDPSKSLDDARRAAALVGADTFIERLPDGYQHDVRERGQTLSHGQRQLLSFIRALVYDPAILVLDEATSSVDTETEEMVQQALGVLMDGRTSLVVAHRLSTIQDADEILVLHKGVVRERGNHQALLAQDGLYRTLYDLQYADQERQAA